MQDPPQQPANQPSYVPYEMPGQEQIQIHVPAHVIPQLRMQSQEIAHMIPQLRMQSQEIAIYANRRQAIWRTAFLIVVLFVLVLLIPFLAIYGDPSAPGSIPALIVGSVVMLPVAAPFVWMAWRMASLIFSHKPLLIINHDGIKVGRIPTQSGFFIPWAEIEAISLYTRTYDYLCIHPGSQKEALKHFPRWERIIKRIDMVFRLPPLIVPQFFLARPVEEIINAIYAGYANELNNNRIQ